MRRVCACTVALLFWLVSPSFAAKVYTNLHRETFDTFTAIGEGYHWDTELLLAGNLSTGFDSTNHIRVERTQIGCTAALTGGDGEILSIMDSIPLYISDTVQDSIFFDVSLTDSYDANCQVRIWYWGDSVISGSISQPYADTWPWHNQVDSRAQVLHTRSDNDKNMYNQGYFLAFHDGNVAGPGTKARFYKKKVGNVTPSGLGSQITLTDTPNRIFIEMSGLGWHFATFYYASGNIDTLLRWDNQYTPSNDTAPDTPGSTVQVNRVDTGVGIGVIVQNISSLVGGNKVSTIYFDTWTVGIVQTTAPAAPPAVSTTDDRPDYNGETRINGRVTIQSQRAFHRAD